MNQLAVEMVDGLLRLSPFAAADVEPLRAACGLDPDIWDIYPVNMMGEDFDAQIAAFHGADQSVRFSVFNGDRLVGTTSYMSPSPENGTVMIGSTYIEPSVRGGDFNRRMKTLMLDHAFACGFWRVEFTIDTRNTRSIAAMRKLGAVHEGTMRKNRVTWTGYVRDTALFSILADEWHTRSTAG
jgi:RimJ/RimL family protein N-acetyltransferase